MIRTAALLACALVVGFVLGSHLGTDSQTGHRVELREAQETHDAPAETKVTESDVEMYIAVYGAMQADHGLTIDDAIASHNVSLDQFRDLERRVQADQRMVDRVRLALLNQAKSHSAWPPGTASGPGEPKSQAEGK
jgi:hypothetical protein